MKTIYLNAEFECSVTKKADTTQSIETTIFDNKCDTYIEGFRFVPQGQEWNKIKNNVNYGVFKGEMVTPFKDYAQLEKAQLEWERDLAIQTVDQLLIAMEV